MQDFRNLAVWRRAHQLTVDVYQVTESFPRSEMFGLITPITSLVLVNCNKSC